MLTTRFSRALTVALLAMLASPSLAQPIEETIEESEMREAPPPGFGHRWAISLDLLVWPSLSDLQPVSGGSFDSLGFGLSGSWHVPVARFSNSELLVGIDGMIGGTDSGINASYDQLLASQFYLGGSVKWAFGDARNIALDAGVGYHEVEMADVSYNWWTTIDNEHWSAESASAFVGLTWDIGGGRPGTSSGLSLGFRVQYADFGRVSDTDRLGVYPALGPNAGNLDGPIYVLKIGYSAR
jgi:hypothetical protein